MGVNGIYGLSGSGLDVESMVKAGMIGKQNEYDKMYKKEVSSTWEKEAYNDIYNDLYKFKFSTLYDYKMQSNMNAMTAASSDTQTVTATANGAAGSMAHKVVVNKLASNAYLMTEDKLSRTNVSSDSSIYLRDLMFGSLKAGDDGKYIVGENEEHLASAGFKFNGVEYNNISYDKDKNKYTFTKADGTADTVTAEEYRTGKFTLKGTLDGAGQDIELDGASVKFGTKKVTDEGGNESTVATLTAATKQTTVDAEAKAVQMKVDDGKGYTTVSYTYKDLLEGGGKTLYDLATDASKDVNITAKYDSATDSMSFYNSDGGKENKITFTAVTGEGDTSSANTVNLLNNLNLAQSKVVDGKTQLEKIGTFEAGVEKGGAGENGEVIIDGKKYDNLTSNKTTVAGVTYTLNNLSVGGAETTVTVTQDTDAIIERVQQFVDDYNEILDKLNEKYSETKYSDYEPLTKKQEEDMTEEQVKKWNEKAKSGLLYHSSTLRTLISDMREAIYTPISSINSKYNSASAIGISSSTNQGHLKLDTDKLKEALAADPDCVYQIFTTSEEETKLNPATGEYEPTGNNVFGGTGLAWRLTDVMTKNITSVSNIAGTTPETNDDSYLGKLITNMQTKMANFKTMMDAFEEQLYKKYDALEVAISKLSTQLGMVTGGGN